MRPPSRASPRADRLAVLARLNEAKTFAVRRATPVVGLALRASPSSACWLIASYPLNAGYYPLAPWAGLAVECAWAASALALAFFLLRRRDA